jgi:hypothetical protein
MSNEMQQYAVYILLQYHSTCFGCRAHPSSGVHKTVVTATGTSHMVVQLPHSSVAKLGLSQGELAGLCLGRGVTNE